MIFFIFLNILFGGYDDNSCIVTGDRDISRQEYLAPEQIQSEHFVIHFTTADNDFQEINGVLYNLQSNYDYAQSIIDYAEISLNKFINDGWEYPPPDCDESLLDESLDNHCINFGGNSLYDIYISNDGPGMVVPENQYPVFPYTGGLTSYMKISTLSNNYESLPSWSHHVVAHEVHHAIQLRYGYGTSGSPGNYIYNLWFFEQTATYMENVVFPNSNHLHTMLANCNVVTPLTYPQYGIDYPAEIYPYRSALWQKYLVESIGDSSIVRYMWEDYGLQFASGNAVSLFPIYENAINIATDNEFSLDEAFDEYGFWRFFTGDRSIPDIYFNESAGYCTTPLIDYEGTYSLLSNTGGAYFVDLPQEGINLSILSDDIDNINTHHIVINTDNEVNVNELLLNENNNINITSIEDGQQILIINTSYFNENSSQVNFTIQEIENNLIGDLNYDGEINVIDVIIIVNFVLLISIPDDNEFYLSDINEDLNIDIIDVVQLINIILSDTLN